MSFSKERPGRPAPFPVQRIVNLAVSFDQKNFLVAGGNMCPRQTSFPGVESRGGQAAALSEIPKIQPQGDHHEIPHPRYRHRFRIHARIRCTDRDHLNGYATMRYSNIYMSGGEKAAVAVKGLGNTTIRLSVYDYNNNLITNTTCRYSTCTLSWVANWNANFYVTVENLTPYGTDFGFAFVRE